jgi:hypothetical protein
VGQAQRVVGPLALAEVTERDAQAQRGVGVELAHRRRKREQIERRGARGRRGARPRRLGSAAT